MNAPGADALARLSLAGSDRLEELAVFPAPGGAVAQGYARQDTVAYMAERDVIWEFEPLDAPAGSGGVSRSTIEPGLYLVELGGEVRIAGRNTAASASGLVAVDARREVAWLRVRGEAGDFVWKLEGDRATCLRVTPGEPLPSLSIPPVQLELFAPREVPAPWLAASFAELAARGDALSRVMAAGLVARLWTSAQPDPDALQRLLAGDHPSPRAVAWMSSLGAQAPPAIEAHAVAAARDLREQLFVLADAVAADPRTPTISWLHRRDDLEGVLHLLRAVDAGSRLAPVLDELDVHARAHALAFRLAPARGDPRLLAVATAEPDRFWGELALA